MTIHHNQYKTTTHQLGRCHWANIEQSNIKQHPSNANVLFIESMLWS